ncbi:hypothetical protein [Halobellus ordinarius]|nr:hypothetical protein [Halobellus sp. ZY16]
MCKRLREYVDRFDDGLAAAVVKILDANRGSINQYDDDRIWTNYQLTIN